MLPYYEEEELPNYFNVINALHYFKVLRDLMYNWVRTQGHQRQLTDSLLSDQIPPSLMLKKNLEVIECYPHPKLQALHILGTSENQLTHAILEHYATLIPKIERFQGHL